jgi:hypothetical protein
MKRALIYTLMAVLAGCLGAVMATAQATDGNIVGAVKDPSGALVPNVSLTLESMTTGVKHTATSDNSGAFRFSNIMVGTYKLSAKATGFTEAVLGGVVVELNQTVTMNIQMSVGKVSTTVEVTEAAPSIDTSTAQLTSSFDSRQSVEIAASNSNSGSGVLNLSLLSAGLGSSGGVGAGSGPSVAGQRPRNNSFNIEGVDNNSKSVTGPLASIPNDAVADFTVLQNQFSAEFGHSSGAQFNTVLKGGGNEIHGTAYEYTQNRNLDALDVAAKLQGLSSRPRYDDNRIGGTVGGPIKKNKLFYFGSFEYQPVGQASVPSSGVETPTAAGYAVIGTIPGISATNLGILQKYAPAPPGPAIDSTSYTLGTKTYTIPLGQIPIVAPNFNNAWRWIGSIDYNISDKDQLRGRYIENRNSAVDTAAELPAFYTSTPTNNYLATMSEFHTFTPNLVNEVRLGFNRSNSSDPAGNFTFPGLDQFPNLYFYDLNLQLGPDGNAPQFGIQNNYQIVDNVTWTKSKHTIKFGFDGRKLISPQSFTQRSRGDYEWTTVVDYLLDNTPDQIAQRSLGNVIYYGDQILAYGYVNDNWKVKPNLTINLGLRYEHTTVPFGERAQSLNSISSVPGVLSFNTPKSQNDAWAPRLGLAWSPGKDGNTSIRAGFGLAYDVLYDNIGILSLPPQLSTTVDVTGATLANGNPVPNFLKNGGISPTASAPSACTTAASCRALTSTYIPDQLLPYTISWNLGIQRVWHKDYTLEVRYVGTKGVHLDTQTHLNIADGAYPGHSLPTYLAAPTQAALNSLPLGLAAGTGAGAVPAIGGAIDTLASAGFTSPITTFLPRGNSIYHGLAVELKRRFSNGFQGQLSYTWSHAIDDSTADFFSTVLSPRRPQDFQNMTAERATSALDRRQRLVLTGIYESQWFKGSSNWMAKNLLGNWTFSGTATKESPELATVQSAGDSNINGDTAPDRAIINTSGVPNTGSAVTALTNSAGQTVAYLAKNPNAEYIQAGKGSLPNAGRNTLPTKGIANIDFSMAKKFNLIGENRVKAEIRADFLNALNHAQFVPGSINDIASIGDTSGAARNALTPGNSIFNQWGQVFSSNPRVIQLGVKIIF